MLCGNGWTLCGHLSWLGHACSVGTRMLEANTGKNTANANNHDKTHQNAAYLRKNTDKNARYVQETQENARENKAHPPSIRLLQR